MSTLVFLEHNGDAIQKGSLGVLSKAASLDSDTAGVLVGFVNVLAARGDVVCIERACQAQGAEACLFELLPAAVAGDVPVVALAPDPALGRQLNLSDNNNLCWRAERTSL